MLFATSVHVGPVSLPIVTGNSAVDALLGFVLLIALFAASIDGMTFAFRGIRDAITQSRGAVRPSVITRVASTLVAVILLFTGGAAAVGIAAWLSGTSSLTSLFRRNSSPSVLPVATD